MYADTDTDRQAGKDRHRQTQKTQIDIDRHRRTQHVVSMFVFFKIKKTH